MCHSKLGCALCRAATPCVLEESADNPLTGYTCERSIGNLLECQVRANFPILSPDQMYLRLASTVTFASFEWVNSYGETVAPFDFSVKSAAAVHSPAPLRVGLALCHMAHSQMQLAIPNTAVPATCCCLPRGSSCAALPRPALPWQRLPEEDCGVLQHPMQTA